MLLKILRFLFGYIRMEVYGFAPERLMNLLIENQIVIWDVATTEQGYEFYTGRKNLLLMKPYLQKTNMKIKILHRYGVPFLIKRYRKRVMFLTGFVLFLVVLYTLSLFVWEVNVTGEDKLVADSIQKRIEKQYIPLGTLKSKIDCAKLEQVLRKDFDEISWISCELKGTGLTVYLEEGMKPKQQGEKAPGDMVATQDATITKMITRQGTPVVKVKDQVKKGDILISGTVYIYDDNNEVMETNYIRADGDVYGTICYTYEDYVDLQYYAKKYIAKSKRYITFYLLDYSFTPYISKKSTENMDTYTQIHKVRILQDFYLPFGYKITRQTPYVLESKTRNEQEAKKILKSRFQKKIKTFKEKKVEIIENDVTIEKKGGKMIATGELILNEPIAAWKESSGEHLIPSSEE